MVILRGEFPILRRRGQGWREDLYEGVLIAKVKQILVCKVNK